jgi:uncharacterized protein (TIGR03083 family)
MVRDLAALLDEMHTARRCFDATLARVPAERWETAGAAGEWSVKDVLAHLTVRLSRLITMLFQVDRGSRLQLPAAGDAQNARDYVEQKDRPLDRVRMDFQSAHAQLVKRLQATDAAGLFDARRHQVLRGRSLADYVLTEAVAHEEEHRLSIEAMLARIEQGGA